MKRETYSILEVKVDELSKNLAIKRLDDLLEKKNPSIICTPNVEFIISAQKDEVFKRILNEESSMNLPDGWGVLWGAKFLSLRLPKQKFLKALLAITFWFLSLLLLPIFVRMKKKPLSEKISGSDFIWDIARWSAEKNLKLFLLGGAPTVAERTALKLQTDVYGLRIGGVHSGQSEEFEEIKEAINRSRSDVLLVAFGSPKQEKWLSQHLKKTCCKIGIGLGGSFDFIAGTQQRAPKWMQNIGLEWLFRLIQEPFRIKRQISLPKFAILILIEKLKS